MPSIGVLEHNQSPTDKPMRRIKRSGGQSLVRQGKAVWIRENVLLQLCLVGTRNDIPVASEWAEVTHKPFIPEKMPPNIDAQLGVIVQAPVLEYQVRFRHV